MSVPLEYSNQCQCHLLFYFFVLQVRRCTKSVVAAVSPFSRSDYQTHFYFSSVKCMFFAFLPLCHTLSHTQCLKSFEVAKSERGISLWIWMMQSNRKLKALACVLIITVCIQGQGEDGSRRDSVYDMNSYEISVWHQAPPSGGQIQKHHHDRNPSNSAARQQHHRQKQWPLRDGARKASAGRAEQLIWTF